MTNFFKALLWFIVLAIIASFTHYLWGKQFCQSCFNDSNQEQVLPVDNTGIVEDSWVEFKIMDVNGKTLFKFPKGFIINRSNGSVDLSGSSSAIKDSLYQFLKVHQDQELLIRGKYLSSETDSLGVSRANALKDMLLEYGVNSDRLVSEGELSDFEYNDNGTYNDGISVLFRQIAEEKQNIIDEHIASKTLYANFAEVDFKPDNSLVFYTDELKRYMEKYTDKKITITGHADNRGSKQGNDNFAYKRAQNVAEYLISQGVDKAHITYLSKGDTEPIASNDTEEGRAQNRRITIQIK